MKKKAIKTVAISLISIIICVLVGLLIWHLTDRGTIKANGEIIELSAEQTQQFRQVLKRDRVESSSGGFGRFTSYGCGFSEDFSICIGGLTYCFGQDDCPSIYVAELDYYYCTSKDNHKEIHRLLNEMTADVG